jgi:putative membrane protein
VPLNLENESHLPDRWIKEINGKQYDEAATKLSMHRTEMSTHRTFLSTTRSHLSNERTHLSYLRTSLSLMSFGVTLNRFSIFLQENQTDQDIHGMLHETEVVGLGIVVAGILILGWALYRYRRVTNEIETDTFTSPHVAMTILTTIILVFAGFSTIWMLMSKA